MMADLKTRVEELKSENEYQLRLKDMSYNDKIKELTEKFIQEMEALKTKNQVRIWIKSVKSYFPCTLRLIVVEWAGIWFIMMNFFYRCWKQKRTKRRWNMKKKCKK